VISQKRKDRTTCSRLCRVPVAHTCFSGQSITRQQVIILLCPREVSQNQRCRVSRENTDRSRFLNFSAHVSWIWSCLRAHVSMHESGNRCRPIESLNGRPTGKETGELKRRVVAAATQTEDLALARGLSSASVAFWTRSRSQELNHRFIPRGDCNVN